MENEHKYRVVAWWTSGQTGIAKSNSAPNAIHFTAPPQFGGLEGRWTPEDLLMTALARLLYHDFPRNRESPKIRIHGPGSRSGGNRHENGHWLRLQRDCYPSEPDDS